MVGSAVERLDGASGQFCSLVKAGPTEFTKVGFIWHALLSLGVVHCWIAELNFMLLLEGGTVWRWSSAPTDTYSSHKPFAWF